MTPPLPRSIGLPSGGELIVREMCADDVDGVASLYEGLDPEDRHNRFFTLYRPDREFFERLATVADRGGGGLVVIHHDGAGGSAGGTIIAEATYSLLENGNGEVEITVGRDWRGWLGPYLLAQLGAMASTRGVPNLEAEILTENRAMRSLTRARGEVFRAGSDWHHVRVVFSASGSVPGWHRTSSPKLLVEARALAWDAVDALSALGFDVLVCRGPDARQHPCPLLAHGCCPLAQDADAIVVALPPTPTRDELMVAHRTLHAEVPVELVERGTGSCEITPAIERAAERAVLSRRQIGGPRGASASQPPPPCAVPLRRRRG